MKCIKWFALMGVAFLVILSMGTVETVKGADPATLERIEKLIQKQQAQLERQARMIEQLKEQVETLSGGVPTAEVKTSDGDGGKDTQAVTRDKIVDEAAQTTTAVAKPLDQTTGVRSGNDKINVQLRASQQGPFIRE